MNETVIKHYKEVEESGCNCPEKMLEMAEDAIFLGYNFLPDEWKEKMVLEMRACRAVKKVHSKNMQSAVNVKAEQIIDRYENLFK